MYQFDIANHVPLNGQVSYADIAAKTGQDETNIRRVIRHAITNRVFCEPREGYVAHTAASAVLVKDHQMVDWSGLCLSEFYGGSAKTIEAMEKYPGSQEPAETGYSLFHSPGQPMFAHIAKDQKRAKRFGNAMVSLTGGEGYEIDYMINSYPWEELDKKGALIVDVSIRLRMLFPKHHKISLGILLCCRILKQPVLTQSLHHHTRRTVH